jgi:hypothetical protein
MNLGKHLFLDISSNNIHTLVPSLYQCDETRGTEVFRLLSEPHPHLAGCYLRLPNVLQKTSRLSCEPLYPTNTSNRKPEIFLHELSPLR